MATSQQENLFYDYEGFVKKFERKKTTDDCYTPVAVYDAVLNYVRKKFNLGDAQIIRPFYPGGDYEHFNYPQNCVVVDNPPFSIFTPILRFYQKHKIKFFLFGPHLTISSNDTDTSYYICNNQIIYENGAVISTSFATNLDKENKIVIDSELITAIENAVKENKEVKQTRKIKLPKNITSVALIGKIATQKVNLKIKKNECHFIRKCNNYQIFGGGYVFSDNATIRTHEAYRKADEERRKADEERRADINLDAQLEYVIKLLNEGKPIK